MSVNAAKKRIELHAETRQILGDRVRHIRAAGLLPAILYGKNQNSVAIQVPTKDFDRVLTLAGESTLVYLSVGDTSYPTLIHDVARHPVTDRPIHADFYKVRLDEKITTKVPVSFVGESLAVRDLGAIFVRNVNELEVQALPTDLPHQIEVDISSLKQFGDQVLLKDLKIHNVKFIGGDDEIVATVQEPKSEEELQAELAAPTTDVSAVEEIKKEEKPAEELAEGEVEAVATAPAETSAA